MYTIPVNKNIDMLIIYYTIILFKPQAMFPGDGIDNDCDGYVDEEDCSENNSNMGIIINKYWFHYKNECMTLRNI